MSHQTSINRRAFSLGLGSALLAPGIARAQTYPARTVTVLVPFAAGGPTDVIARVYAEFLSRDLGQTFVIENVAGAGGTIGSNKAAKATPTATPSRSVRPEPMFPASGCIRTSAIIR